MPPKRHPASHDDPKSETAPTDRQDADSSPSPGPKDVVALYLSPDDQYLAVGTRNNRLAVYGLRGERLGNLLGEWDADLNRKAMWSRSGRSLAFVNTDGDIRVIQVPGGRSSIVAGPAHALAWHPSGSVLAVADEATLKIHEFSSLSYTRRQDLRPSSGNMGPTAGYRPLLAFSPDGNYLIRVNEGGAVETLDRVSYRVFQELRFNNEIITDITWIAPNLLVTGSVDESIRLLDVQRNDILRMLEVGKPVIGITYAPYWKCVAAWTHDTFLLWSVTTGEIMWEGPLATQAAPGDRPIAPFNGSGLLVTLDGPAINDITFSSGWGSSPGRRPGSVRTYTNAKVLLVGDSGVGKSGLALVLAGEEFRPTESTHARRIWRMPAAELKDEEGSQREILIWDLAGQPGYRMVHQLHLNEAALALVLFDSSSETRPLEGIGYWARALQQAQVLSGRSKDELPTFLIAARTDRSTVSVSNDRINEIVIKFGFRAFMVTSAMEGWGVEELRREILAAIDWQRIPVVTSSALFAAAKSFVLDQKAAGTLLAPLTMLHGTFIKAPITGLVADVAPDARVGGDLLGAGASPSQEDQERLRRVFEVCVARLESTGLVKRLAFGDLILLQPELIDVYAGAIVNAAREDTDGLGSILESDVVAMNFRFPRHERIADASQEQLLVIATLGELSRYEIVLHEATEAGIQLVFPAAFRRDLPELSQPFANDVQLAFEGPVDNIYATLIVRLARSDRFTRLGSWNSAAQFQPDTGGVCNLQLARRTDGRGTLQLGYSEDVAEMVRSQFERFILTHLERRALPGTVRRTRSYLCPACKSPFGAEQIDAARKAGREVVRCPADDTQVALEPRYRAPSGAEDSITRKMDASADAARNAAAASSIILGKEATTDFDVFLCHNAADKAAVRWAAERLRKEGVLPWLDEDELTPGRPWQTELEQQISRIKAAAVFVGPSGVGPWQRQELMAFLNDFVERQAAVIPVMLPGATPPELPAFLRNMTWVDLRDKDEAGIKRLIWGITGRKPTA